MKQSNLRMLTFQLARRFSSVWSTCTISCYVWELSDRIVSLWRYNSLPLFYTLPNNSLLVIFHRYLCLIFRPKSLQVSAQLLRTHRWMIRCNGADPIGLRIVPLLYAPITLVNTPQPVAYLRHSMTTLQITDAYGILVLTRFSYGLNHINRLRGMDHRNAVVSV